MSASAPDRIWILASLVFAALWLFTLVWGLQQRAKPTSVTEGASVRPVTRSTPGNADLKRVLTGGDFNAVTDVLRAMAHPPAGDIDELIERLDDPMQREALATLQRARWGDGDGAAARSALRNAFARGPSWRRLDLPPPSPLPPLYPPKL